MSDVILLLFRDILHKTYTKISRWGCVRNAACIFFCVVRSWTVMFIRRMLQGASLHAW